MYHLGNLGIKPYKSPSQGNNNNNNNNNQTNDNIPVSEEELELQKAIEESNKTKQIEDIKKKEELEFQKAIKESLRIQNEECLRKGINNSIDSPEEENIIYINLSDDVSKYNCDYGICDICKKSQFILNGKCATCSTCITCGKVMNDIYEDRCIFCYVKYINENN